MHEAEDVLSRLLGCSRTDLLIGNAAGFDREVSKKLAGILRRRIAGEPLQYIVGETEFMGRRFFVTPDVLIPRPETELLVEAVAAFVRGKNKQAPGSLRVLDAGTGSGCIAISLAKELPCCLVDAIDVSEAALAVARRNAALHGAAVTFRRSAIGDDQPGAERYDIIVSNPPYIASDEIASLQPEIAHEPRLALDGGKDGCDAFRRLIPWAARLLNREGRLIFEIGRGEAAMVHNIIEKNRGFTIVEIVKDYAGIERVIVVRRRNG